MTVMDTQTVMDGGWVGEWIMKQFWVCSWPDPPEWLTLFSVPKETQIPSLC